MAIQDAFELVVKKLYGWYETLVLMLPNLVVAMLVAVVAWFVAQVARKLVSRALHRISDNRTLVQLAAKIISFVILLVGLFVALGILKLDKTVTSLLAGAGVIGLALGFAFQDITANFLSGILLSLRRPFVVGDVVELADFFGTVERVDLRNTWLRTPDGKLVLIPNREVFENAMTNFSQNRNLRVELPVGVSYASDLDQVAEVTRAAVEAIEGRTEGRDVEVLYTDFGGSSIDLVVRFWIPFARPVDINKAKSEAVVRIKKAYDEHGIVIPFPIRTLDFGISGGQKLSEMWPRRFAAEPAEGAGAGGSGEPGEQEARGGR